MENSVFLKLQEENIPILIICYNNYKYIENMLNQLLKINEKYYKNIIILDNLSTCIDTVHFLKNTNVKVIYNTENAGPHITAYNNKHIYDSLPDKFILTDPDLQFNENLPNNFIETLSNLSDIYKCEKIGFALDIEDFDAMYQTTYFKGMTIYEWENRFWQSEITNDNFQLYNAPIDTTFCLVNKNYSELNIRIAGNFTSKHLPWYKDNKVYTVYENYMANTVTTNISTISNVIIPYTETKYSKIYKKDQLFLIENNENNPNLHFWKNIYSYWENYTFDVFDKYLDNDKVFIDIGGWIGTTAMYGKRKSKFVYCIEADKKSFDDMSVNFKINCDKNYMLINKAVYNIDNIEIKFGKNKFLENSKMNDSTSQIYDENETSDDYYVIKTITIENIIKNNNIETNEISLIKVDIEGGEEHILDDLFQIYKKYNAPLYISFHYSWWKNKNLERFTFLTEDQKNLIINDPFISILFD